MNKQFKVSYTEHNTYEFFVEADDLRDALDAINRSFLEDLIQGRVEGVKLLNNEGIFNGITEVVPQSQVQEDPGSSRSEASG